MRRRHVADAPLKDELLDEHNASAPEEEIGSETQVITSRDMLDATADPVDETSPNGPRHRKYVDPDKRMITWIVGVCLTVLIIAGIVVGIVLGVRRYSEHRLSNAQSACQQAATTVKKKAEAYSKYVNGTAASAKSITSSEVADATTVTELTSVITKDMPQTIACSANSIAQFNTQTDKLNEQITWYDNQQASLENAVKNVQDSKQQKTVDDARSALTAELEDARNLLVVTKGHLEDDTLWTTLSNLVDQADDMKNGDNADHLTDMTTQLQEAAQATSDSYQAKLDADQAAAEAEQEAHQRQEDAQKEAQASASASASAAASSQSSQSPAPKAKKK